VPGAKEWLAVAVDDDEMWPVLVGEALDFVGSRRR
jgi:hypothetical protein